MGGGGGRYRGMYDGIQGLVNREKFLVLSIIHGQWSNYPSKSVPYQCTVLSFLDSDLDRVEINLTKIREEVALSLIIQTWFLYIAVYRYQPTLTKIKKVKF